MAARLRLLLSVLWVVGLAACVPEPSLAGPPPATPTAAEPVPLLTWQRERPLTWDDFKAPPPAGDQRDSQLAQFIAGTGVVSFQSTHEAASTTSMLEGTQYHYSYTCTSSSGSPQHCTVTAVTLDPMHALFDPNTSWVIRSEESPRLLQHEQGHFDVAAIFAAQLDTRLHHDLQATVGQLAVDQPTEDLAAGAIKTRMASIADSAQRDIFTAFEKEQTQYDAETNHGLDGAAQDRWTAQLHQALAATGQ